MYIQTDKRTPSTEHTKYLLLETCKEADEGVRMQCREEYFSEMNETQELHNYKTMNEEERKAITKENLATGCYVGRFGYLTSLSASHSNLNFKAKHTWDDLMCSSVESEGIIKDLWLMEVMCTDRQRQREKNSENFKKKQHMNGFIDILSKK